MMKLLHRCWGALLPLCLMACQPNNTDHATATTASSKTSQAVQNGFTDSFEKEYVAQCLKEQTSVNVDTKVFCLCMGSFVVRDNQAKDFMPLWQAHLSGSKTDEQQAQWEQLAQTAKKQRGCKIEKF